MSDGLYDGHRMEEQVKNSQRKRLVEANDALHAALNALGELPDCLELDQITTQVAEARAKLDKLARMRGWW